MTRWDASTDANHSLIAYAARSAGASVHNTHRVGGGFGDQLWGIAGLNLLVEAKTNTGRLNKNELLFHTEWRGQIAVVRTVEEQCRTQGADTCRFYAEWE